MILDVDSVPVQVSGQNEEQEIGMSMSSAGQMLSLANRLTLRKGDLENYGSDDNVRRRRYGRGGDDATLGCEML